MFATDEECLSALRDGLVRLSAAAREGAGRGEECAPSEAGAGALPDERRRLERRWVARVRAGLVGLLGFLDDEPDWGRLSIVGARELGAAGLECERRVVALLEELLTGERPLAWGVESETAGHRGLVDELVAGGVLSLIRARLLDPDGERLVELAPALMSFVVASYLGQERASAEHAAMAVAEREPLVGASYKRASARGSFAPMSMTGAYRRGDRWSQHGALSQTSGVGGSPGGGLARRSIGNREDKGVVDK